jgi:hypothetical protein
MRDDGAATVSLAEGDIVSPETVFAFDLSE